MRGSLHRRAQTTPQFWGTGLLFLLFSLTRKLGGVTKRYPLTDDGSVLFPMLYGYYRRVSRRWLVYACFSAFYNGEYAVFRIILHHRFTIMLLFEHELPLIVINLCRGDALSLTRIYTVNNVRKLSTSPVQRVTTASGKRQKNCQPNSGKDNTPLQLLQCYSSKKCFHKPQNKVLNLYLYIYIYIDI